MRSVMNDFFGAGRKGLAFGEELVEGSVIEIRVAQEWNKAESLRFDLFAKHVRGIENDRVPPVSQMAGDGQDRIYVAGCRGNGYKDVSQWKLLIDVSDLSGIAKNGWKPDQGLCSRSPRVNAVQV